MKSLKENFIYNVVYQVLILVIPLVTIPYVSRILHSNGVGTYSYTYSIVYYFMLLAMLGLNNYGNRSIAKVRDDKSKLSKTFKEIYVFQFITSLTMIVLYLSYVLLFENKFKDIAVIQSLYVFSCMFDINWFFFGIEKFKLTVTRNTIIKILTLISIFLFVRSKNDLWIYTLILSGSTLISQLALWPFLKRHISKEKISMKNVKQHIKPCLILFLPVIAVAIYRMMDKTMIGIFSTMNEVGYYESGEKIINVPIAIINALGTVMLPRMSNLYAKGLKKESMTIIKKSITFILFLSIPMMLGLIAISKDFTLIFFGKEYIKTYLIIILLSSTIIFLSWGNVIRTQYLIPLEYDDVYIKSAFLGAGVNLIFNLIFIPIIYSYGACIGTIIAEFLVMFYQSYKIRKELPLKEYIKSGIPFAIKGIVMFILIYSIRFLNINIYLKISIQIIFAFIIYFTLNYKYILNIIDIKKIFIKLKIKPKKA